MKNKPLVSIIIPVYNGSNFVSEAIQSALNQTYNNCEVLVINDGSNDNGKTKQCVLQFGERIQYFEKINGGVASALNFGLKHALGDYISWLSHDDIYYENKIQVQMDEMLEQDEQTLIWSNYDLIDENSNILVKFEPKTFKFFDTSLEYILNTRVHGCSLLIPKKAFNDVGNFDETLRTTQDNDMWFRMVHFGYKLIHINQSLIQSRQHKEQGSIVLRDIQKCEIINFYKKVYSILEKEITKNILLYKLIMNKINKKNNSIEHKSFNVSNYWENRYTVGKNSGFGSYGENAEYKSNILNGVIREYKINSLIEFGCGDGNNLGLYKINNYIGFDIAKKAIDICINTYKNDESKTFIYYEPFLFKASNAFKADITISFEVLFHLVEDRMYKKYIHDLFISSKKYVLVFSTNFIQESEAIHMKYREFTKDVPLNFKLVKFIKTPSHLNLLSDFYLFERTEK